jgi:hypothetical protein
VTILETETFPPNCGDDDHDDCDDNSASPCQEAEPGTGRAREEYARSLFTFPTTRPLTVMAPCTPATPPTLLTDAMLDVV